MVSKEFPIYHTNKGQPTGFEEKINSGEKVHTIRGNYPFWKKRADKINAGEAILSIRQWSGKPYKSPQVEIKQLHRLGIQKFKKFEVVRLNMGFYTTIGIDNVDDFQFDDLFTNDGLNEVDFLEWFNKPLKDSCILHFTDLRY